MNNNIFNIDDGVLSLKSEFKPGGKKYKSLPEKIIIPEKINDKNIYELEEECFANCERIKSVIIKSSNLHILKNAFLNCSNLEHYEAPASIKYSYLAFEGCNKLSEIILTSNKISNLPSNNLFNKCRPWDFGTNDKIIKIEEGCLSIGEYAFSKCSFATIFLPKTLVRISNNVFHDCDKLTCVCYAGNKSEWENVNKYSDFYYDLGIADIEYEKVNYDFNDVMPLIKKEKYNDAATLLKSKSKSYLILLKFEINKKIKSDSMELNVFMSFLNNLINE